MKYKKRNKKFILLMNDLDIVITMLTILLTEDKFCLFQD